MTVATNGWAVGDWAYKGYELVQVKEMDGTRVSDLTTGFIRMSSNDFSDRLFRQTLSNKQIAETIEIYYNRITQARGGCMLNHPDINRKFEEFAWRAMAAEPEGQEQKEIMEEAREVQQKCSERLQDAILIQVDGVYVFNHNQPY